MNKDTMIGNWNELKGKVRQQWAKLTDDDLSYVKGNWDELAGRLQRAYGLKKEKAIEEIEAFKKRMSAPSDEEIKNNPTAF